MCPEEARQSADCQTIDAHYVRKTDLSTLFFDPHNEYPSSKWTAIVRHITLHTHVLGVKGLVYREES